MGRVEIGIDEYFVAHLAPEHDAILAGHPRIDGEVVVETAATTSSCDQGRRLARAGPLSSASPSGSDRGRASGEPHQLRFPAQAADVGCEKTHAHGFVVPRLEP